MSRLVLPAAFAVLVQLTASAFAQATIVPGPGGTPIAPGAPVPGFTPGGVGPGGTDVGPGPAARGVPMYRIGPGGTPLAPRPDPYATEPSFGLYRGCGNGGACPPGETLPQYGRLTVNSRDSGTGTAPSAEKPVNSMRELLAALRTCWHPPELEHANRSSQMTVRVSFKRTGDVIGSPVVTYATRGMSADTKRTYLDSIRAAFERCSPLPLSKSFSAAIAGVPISIRYVDDKTARAGSRQR